MYGKQMSPFPTGRANDAYARYFTGQSYLNPLCTDPVGISTVTFSPACRNHWHIHTAAMGGGQILIVTAGKGYYQEWGQAPIELKAGDVVNIRPGVKHWHGATANEWFQHLTVAVPGTDCSAEWCGPVCDDAYLQIPEQARLRGAYEEMYHAMESKDVEAFRRLMDDSYVLVHMSGARQSGADFLAGIASGALNYCQPVHDRISAEIHGETAIVTGRTRFRFHAANGEPREVRLQQRITFGRHENRWRMLLAECSAY